MVPPGNTGNLSYAFRHQQRPVGNQNPVHKGSLMSNPDLTWLRGGWDGPGAYSSDVKHSNLWC